LIRIQKSLPPTEVRLAIPLGVDSAA